jgi:Acyl-CoA dehydrogenase, C-terminal domain
MTPDADRIARDESLEGALLHVYASLGTTVLPYGPGGHAVAPASLAESAQRLWFGGTVTARDPALETVVADPLLAGEGLVGLRRRGAPASGTKDGLSADLALVRLGLSERLLDDCLDYLSARTVGDAPLLDQQLVRGDLADAGTDLVELRVLLSGPGVSDVDLPWLHDRLTDVDRLMLRLLGASGFLADGPGRRAAVGELLSDTYVGHPPEEPP